MEEAVVHRKRSSRIAIKETEKEQAREAAKKKAEEEEEGDDDDNVKYELMLANKWDLESGLDPTGWYAPSTLCTTSMEAYLTRQVDLREA